MEKRQKTNAQLAAYQLFHGIAEKRTAREEGSEDATARKKRAGADASTDDESDSSDDDSSDD